ncbi:MAG: RluA family pseudouridine synthase, partial [Ruminococcaceae bacterium]|nr:RluA family pseudouridine synthase [Oscillospiraceae bacterium]
GDEVAVSVPAPTAPKAIAQDIPLNVVYEDGSVLVINKPAGMVVHPAAGNYEDTLVNALLHHCGDSLSAIGGVLRPGIVHRIDKDTTGLLIVAKGDRAHQHLSEQLKTRTLSRKYYALVHGNVKEDAGTINVPLGRDPKDRKKMAVVKTGGREAVTHFEVIERFGQYTLVRCKLQTGRTHQIRVHMRHIGHPIVGDKTYGIKKEAFQLDGQLLHAGEIGFIHPETEREMTFSVPLPEAFEHILQILRNR